MDVAKVDREMLHMLQLFQGHVACICFECFRYFRAMFHLSFLDACCKCVYLDVAYVSHRPPPFSSDIEVALLPSNCMRSVIYIVSAMYVYTLLVARYRCPDGPAR